MATELMTLPLEPKMPVPPLTVEVEFATTVPEMPVLPGS
jgi:hypothetical protein